MKKPVLIAHVLLIVVSAVLGSYLAAELYVRQGAIRPYRKDLTKAPLGGFQKFTASAEWMRFIQYLGSQSSVNDENIDETVKRLERLISLDPNFEKAYSVGVQMMAVQDPERAVEFLKNACENEHLKTDWKLPFYTAFIMNQHVEKDMTRESIPYYEMAIKRSSGSPEPYVVNAYVRTMARDAFKDGKGKTREGNTLENEDHAALFVLQREWKKSSRGGEEMMMGDGMVLIPNIRERIFATALRIMTAEASTPELKAYAMEVRDEVSRGSLDQKFMTPEEVAARATTELGEIGSLGEKMLATIKAAETDAIAKIAAAERDAIARIRAAANGDAAAPAGE